MIPSFLAYPAECSSRVVCRQTSDVPCSYLGRILKSGVQLLQRRSKTVNSKTVLAYNNLRHEREQP